MSITNLLWSSEEQSLVAIDRMYYTDLGRNFDLGTGFDFGSDFGSDFGFDSGSGSGCNP